MAKVTKPIKTFWQSKNKPDWLRLSRNDIVSVRSDLKPRKKKIVGLLGAIKKEI